jgi:thioredoxin reductase
LDKFAGKQVLVIGGGASGVGIAGLMALKDAAVSLAVRKPRIAYVDPPRPRSLLDRVQAPMSGLGTGWRSLACVVAPMVFHRMPQDLRIMVVRKHLPAAPGWTSRDPVENLVDKHLGFVVAGARERGGRAEVTLLGLDGTQRLVVADHVIAATGYKVDMRRLTFLSAALQAKLSCVDHTPILSPHFETSVPGLYVVGTAAANSFGPMLRFAYGAGFASRRVTSHIARSTRKSKASFEPLLVPART